MHNLPKDAQSMSTKNVQSSCNMVPRVCNLVQTVHNQETILWICGLQYIKVLKHYSIISITFISLPSIRKSIVIGVSQGTIFSIGPNIAQSSKLLISTNKVQSIPMSQCCTIFYDVPTMYNLFLPALRAKACAQIVPTLHNLNFSRYKVTG